MITPNNKQYHSGEPRINTEEKCNCACHDTEWNSIKKHSPVVHDKKCCSAMNGTLSIPTDTKQERCKHTWGRNPLGWKCIECSVIKKDAFGILKDANTQENCLVNWSEDLQQLINEHVGGRIDSVHIHDFVQHLLQNAKQTKEFHSFCPDCKTLIPNKHFECIRKTKQEAVKELLDYANKNIEDVKFNHAFFKGNVKEYAKSIGIIINDKEE